MSYEQLTLRQRYEIKAYMQADISKKQIGKLVGVHKTTIYRELKRNESPRGYDPEQAQMKVTARRKGARKHIRFTDAVKERVETLLRLDLSPEQVSGRLAREEQIPNQP
jgi:IS30 family transposase